MRIPPLHRYLSSAPENSLFLFSSRRYFELISPGRIVRASPDVYMLMGWMPSLVRARLLSAFIPLMSYDAAVRNSAHPTKIRERFISSGPKIPKYSMYVPSSTNLIYPRVVLLKNRIGAIDRRAKAPLGDLRRGLRGNPFPIRVSGFHQI